MVRRITAARIRSSQEEYEGFSLIGKSIIGKSGDIFVKRVFLA
jgi:hypothetical protein